MLNLGYGLNECIILLSNIKWCHTGPPLRLFDKDDDLCHWDDLTILLHFIYSGTVMTFGTLETPRNRMVDTTNLTILFVGICLSHQNVSQ